MSNLATVLREEIRRLARKEVKDQTELLRRQSAQYRRDIATLKRKAAELEKRLALVEKNSFREPPKASQPVENVRFSAKGLRSHRKKLGLSGADYAALLGVSMQTLCNWEQERSRPRASQMEAISGLRGMGKKEALARLAQA